MKVKKMKELKLKSNVLADETLIIQQNGTENGIQASSYLLQDSAHFKGWFISSQELTEFCPTSIPGDYAYVGALLHQSTVYRCATANTWENTNEIVELPEVDLVPLITQLNAVEDNSAKNTEKIGIIEQNKLDAVYDNSIVDNKVSIDTSKKNAIYKGSDYFGRNIMIGRLDSGCVSQTVSLYDNELLDSAFRNMFRLIALKGNWNKNADKVFISSFVRLANTEGNTNIQIDLGSIKDDKITSFGKCIFTFNDESTEVSSTITGLNGYADVSGYMVIDSRATHALLNKLSIQPEQALLNSIVDLNDKIETSPVDNNDGRYLKRAVSNIEESTYSYDTLLVTSDNVVWATQGYSGILYKSTDLVTYTAVMTLPFRINSLRELQDGELLIIMHSDRAITDLTRTGIWKTTNGRTGKKQVQQYSTNYTTVVNDWGVSVVGDKILIAEYGNFNEDPSLRGSRYLYYSSDNGESFSKVLDLHNNATLFPTADGWKQAHIHCCAYDAYWDRLWISTGDGNNSKILGWSDDFGNTWKSINLYQYQPIGYNIQFISFGVLSNCILAGTDIPQQGIFRINRTTKDAIPVVEIAYPFKEQGGISHLTGIMRRFDSSGPLLIPVNRGTYVPTEPEKKHSYILATYDGHKFWEIWRDKKLSYYPNKTLSLHKYSNKLLMELWTEENNKCRYFADFPVFE